MYRLKKKKTIGKPHLSFDEGDKENCDFLDTVQTIRSFQESNNQVDKRQQEIISELEVNKKLIRKCTLCGREYLKPQTVCPKCNIVLMKLSDYKRLGMDANRANFQKEVERREKLQKEQNTIKYPNCQSTDVQKLSTASKVIGVGLLDLVSKTVGKTWKCNNCGSKF